MTPYASCLHTHSVLCDGKSTLGEMARAACAAGVQVFGASGHSHTPVPMDQGQVLGEDLSAYRQAVLGLREGYAGRMTVLLGLELDGVSRQTVPPDFDYWIGSVHYLADAAAGRYYAVDWERTQLTACRDELFGGEISALTAGYYQAVAAMAARRPTILGHMDLICKLNGNGILFDEQADGYRQAALAALDCADPAATLLEINTGAVARGYRSKPYPAQFLLRAWRARGGQVVITSDCHSADAILYGYDLAVQWAQAAGYTRSITLTEKGWKTCEF